MVFFFAIVRSDFSELIANSAAIDLLGEFLSIDAADAINREEGKRYGF